jgi:hypothetical protein
MTFRAFWIVAVLAAVPAVRAGESEVTAIHAVHRHGQTFVTWKDVAEGDEGSKFRYSLYRADKPGPIQAIKLYDSKERKTYVAQTSITGQKGLPLSVSLHGSQGQGGPAGEWGDYYLYFGTPDMG